MAAERVLISAESSIGQRRSAVEGRAAVNCRQERARYLARQAMSVSGWTAAAALVWFLVLVSVGLAGVAASEHEHLVR